MIELVYIGDENESESSREDLWSEGFDFYSRLYD